MVQTYFDYMDELVIGFKHSVNHTVLPQDGQNHPKSKHTVKLFSSANRFMTQVTPTNSVQ